MQKQTSSSLLEVNRTITSTKYTVSIQKSFLVTSQKLNVLPQTETALEQHELYAQKDGSVYEEGSTSNARL